MEKKEFTVTPWEVKGEVDYDKLVEQFGVQKIDNLILNRIQNILKNCISC